MPHQCVRCNTFYNDAAQEIVKGCKCGGRLFFYIKKEKLEEAQRAVTSLTKEEKEQIEADIIDLIGEGHKPDEPVVLDFESIRVLKPGKYELDLVQIFRGEPLIIKLAEGKYWVDLPTSLRSRKKS